MTCDPQRFRVSGIAHPAAAIPPAADGPTGSSAFVAPPHGRRAGVDARTHAPVTDRAQPIGEREAGKAEQDGARTIKPFVAPDHI